MRKRNKKLSLNRETVRTLDLMETAGGTIVIFPIITAILTRQCPISQSIDPPGCCITIQPCNPCAPDGRPIEPREGQPVDH